MTEYLSVRKENLHHIQKLNPRDYKQPKIKNCHNENHLRGNFMYNPP